MEQAPELKLTVGMPTLDDYDGVFFTLQALRMYHPEVMAHTELLVVDNNPDSRIIEPLPDGRPGMPRWTRGRQHSQLVVGLGEHLYSRTYEALARGGPGVPDLGKFTYVPLDQPRGTALAKNKVFEAASAPLVLCVDSHVLLWPGALSRLIRWFDANPQFNGMVQGPLVYDGLSTFSTHFHDEWGTDAMWGTWASAWRHKPCGTLLAPRPLPGGKVGFYDVTPGMVSRTSCPGCGAPLPAALDWFRHEESLTAAGLEEVSRDLDADPFEIPACGMGCFAARKSDWLWYNANFRGFGGEEWYIHTKYRKAGRKTLCLPFMRWLHRFGRVSVPYALPWYDKARNYVIGHTELGLSLDPVHKAFVEGGKLPQDQWGMLVDNPANPPLTPGTAVPAKAAGTVIRSEEGRVEWRSNMNSLQEWLEAAANANHPYKPQQATLLKYLEGAEHVTEMGGRRRYSTVLILGSKPKHYLLIDPSPGPEMPELARFALPNTQVNVLPTRSEKVDHSTWLNACVGSDKKTDVLFLDTSHNGIQLTGEFLLYAPRVRRRIILPNTATHGSHGEGASEGMVPAIRRLVKGELPVAKEDEWFIAAHEPTGFGMTVLSRDPADRPKRPIVLWPPEGGPGTEMKAMLAGLGVNPGPTCDCNAKAVQMDLWGVEGCRANRNTIVGWLRDNAPRWGWADRVKAAANAVINGLAFKLNPLDPFPGVLDEAIRRAEEKEKAAEAKRLAETAEGGDR